MVPFRPVLREDATTAALAGAAGIAGSYAVAGATRAFVAAPAEALVVAALPGPVVAAGIRWFGFFGETLAFATAVVAAVVVLGAGVPAAARAADARATAVAAASAWAFVVVLAATGAPASALGTAVPVAAVALLRSRPPAAGEDTSREPQRRRWLALVAGALGFGVVSYAVGSTGGIERLTRGTADTAGPAGATPDDRMAELGDAVDERLAEVREQSFDAPEMPGLVSEREEFYEVDINTIDPQPDAASWSLSVTGAVDRRVTLSMGDLLALPPEHRVETLRCVSDPVDGGLMDTAVWTGVPIESLLDRAAPRGSWVMLRCADGYHVGFPIEALQDGLLAYGMNGGALPRGHGYPVRALVPGHWGEVNAKWIEEIEVLDQERDGYWEKRGWHGTGPVNTVAKIWGEQKRDDGVVELGGHAYAGTRGIEQVEILPGLRNEWVTVELGPQLAGADTWRQWRYEWEAPPDGTYWVVARATDGAGDRQPSQEQQPYPSGSTGWMRRPVTVGDDPGVTYR